jgi:hypothetical protein
MKSDQPNIYYIIKRMVRGVTCSLYILSQDLEILTLTKKSLEKKISRPSILHKGS